MVSIWTPVGLRRDFRPKPLELRQLVVPPSPRASSTTEHAITTPPTPSRADVVAREDVVLFVNACFACTNQNEFYGDSRGQAVAISFLHDYVLGNYRRLYARTLAIGINHMNQAEILFRLLASGRETEPEDRREEGDLIRSALAGLPPPRARRDT